MTCTLFVNPSVRIRLYYWIFVTQSHPDSPMVSDLPAPLLEFHGIAGNWTQFSMWAIMYIAWPSPIGKDTLLACHLERFAPVACIHSLFSLPTHIQFCVSSPKVGSKRCEKNAILCEDALMLSTRDISKVSIFHVSRSSSLRVRFLCKFFDRFDLTT